MKPTINVFPFQSVLFFVVVVFVRAHSPLLFCHFFEPISISPTQCHYVMPVFEYNAMQKSYVKLIVFKLDFKLELFWGFLFFTIL